MGRKRHRSAWFPSSDEIRVRASLARIVMRDLVWDDDTLDQIFTHDNPTPEAAVALVRRFGSIKSFDVIRRFNAD